MSDSMSGAFLCSGFNARRSTATQAFCKPVNVRIYSAPPPVRYRVVTYQMQFIEGIVQPQTSEAWAEAKDYQSPYSGARSFSYLIGTLKIDIDDLMNQIRRHFYASVLKGESGVGRELSFSRLMRENTATRRYIMNETTLLQVSKVHHLRHIEVDASGNHSERRAAVRYQGEITDNRGISEHDLDYQDRYISCDHNYTSGSALISSAVEHFSQLEVQAHVIASLTK